MSEQFVAVWHEEDDTYYGGWRCLRCGRRLNTREPGVLVHATHERKPQTLWQEILCLEVEMVPIGCVFVGRRFKNPDTRVLEEAK